MVDQSLRRLSLTTTSRYVDATIEEPCNCSRKNLICAFAADLLVRVGESRGVQGKQSKDARAKRQRKGNGRKMVDGAAFGSLPLLPLPIFKRMSGGVLV